MGTDEGLRPLNIELFQHNNLKQPLRVVSSCVETDRAGCTTFSTKCFGHQDWFEEETQTKEILVEKTTTRTTTTTHTQDHPHSTPPGREGLFACLQASMTVPGATGPPVDLMRRPKTASQQKQNEDHAVTEHHESAAARSSSCFDAFCFEPIPYRSAVREGATHVLALTTRPTTHVPKTKPGIYEKGIAPLYFHSHGQPAVAKFFQQGGQQYLYAEDLLLLREAATMQVPVHEDDTTQTHTHTNVNAEETKGILVPPPTILHGIPMTTAIADSIANRESQWDRAHILPITVSHKHKELEVLEQDKEEVLAAIRGGFETAFDALSDLVGLEYLDGSEVAKFVFPSSSEAAAVLAASSRMTQSSSSPSSTTLSASLLEHEILETQIYAPGAPIPEYINNNSVNIKNPYNTTDAPKTEDANLDTSRRIADFFFDPPAMTIGGGRGEGIEAGTTREQKEGETNGGLFGYGSHTYNHTKQHDITPKTLLECLPGFQNGRHEHLAKGLREGIQRPITKKKHRKTS